MRYLKNEIIRSIRAPQFWFAVFVCLIIYVGGEGFDGWISIVCSRQGTWIHHHNGFMLEFNPFRSLLPFPAALAAGSLFAEDWEHRSIYFQTTRCSFRRYCCVKFIVPCIMGGLVLAFGLLCYLGFMGFFIPAYNDETYYEPFIEPIISKQQWTVYFLYFCSLQFMLGVLCAGISTIVATITSRRGMIFLIPMIVLAMIEIVTDITIVGLSGAQSSIVFSLDTDSPMLVYLVIFCILLFLILTVFFCFRFMIKKRVFQWQ